MIIANVTCASTQYNGFFHFNVQQIKRDKSIDFETINKSSCIEGYKRLDFETQGKTLKTLIQKV